MDVTNADKIPELLIANSNITKGQILWAITTVIYHTLVLAVTGYLLYLARNFSTTDLHASLCTIGCVLLMSEAIVVFAETNTWTHFLSRRTRTHLHWIFQACGTICCIVGIAIMYCSKRRHFRSAHAIIGITSVATVTCLFTSGISILFAQRLRSIIPPIFIKFVHSILGITCFILGITAQFLG